MTSDELLAEIAKVHAALKKLDAGETIAPEGEAKPSVTVKDAFKKNEVVCLICGKGGFEALARHLTTADDMKPAAYMKPATYKKQFGIPSKQSLASKSYSEARRKMANDRGLADNLAKARDVRMANIEAQKAPAKAAKTAPNAKAPAKATRKRAAASK